MAMIEKVMHLEIYGRYAPLLGCACFVASLCVALSAASTTIVCLVIFLFAINVMMIISTRRVANLPDPEAPQAVDDPMERLEGCMRLLRKQLKEHTKQGVTEDQVFALLWACYCLRQARTCWGSDPDGTWGIFLERLQVILASKRKPPRMVSFSEWCEVSRWCSTQCQKTLLSILQAAVDVHTSPVPLQVMQLSKALE
eukprot:symbB.v1.2.034021.t1/scaffold4317.1/size41413/2